MRNAGLAAAGLAACPLVGCGDDSIAIPCLGPADPPQAVPGMTYIWASKIGCALDCNLQDGTSKYTGGHATDDAPTINAAMASATADRPITLIIDGSALISGLFLPAAGHWSIAGLGCGTGFFVKSGTNNDGIHNGPPGANVPADPGPPAPPRGQNVSLMNFTLNGNRGHGRSGNSTTGDVRGGKSAWYIGINLMNLDHITMKNVVVVNSPSYLVRFSNVGHVTVSGCVLQARGYNTDGLHFNGPANDITITGCDFKTDDDSIALNCPEGYSGNISRLSVIDCSFDSWSLMRLYTTNGDSRQFAIDTVSVKNCKGTFSEVAFYIGLNAASDLDAITGLIISDCTLAGPAVLGVSENFGTIRLQNVIYQPIPSHVEPKPFHVCAFLRTTPFFNNATYIGANLELENCSIDGESEWNVVTAALDNQARLGRLRFNGFSLLRHGARSPIPVLVEIGSGSIGELVLDSVESGNIAAPVTGAEMSRLGLVSGAGVLATKWPFPDAVMAERVPYISAATGLPSIKINGTVEPYQAP